MVSDVHGQCLGQFISILKNEALHETPGWSHLLYIPISHALVTIFH